MGVIGRFPQPCKPFLIIRTGLTFREWALFCCDFVERNRKKVSAIKTVNLAGAKRYCWSCKTGTSNWYISRTKLFYKVNYPSYFLLWQLLSIIEHFYPIGIHFRFHFNYLVSNSVTILQSKIFDVYWVETKRRTTEWQNAGTGIDVPCGIAIPSIF